MAKDTKKIIDAEKVINAKTTRAGYEAICRQESLRENINAEDLLNGITTVEHKLAGIDRELQELRRDAKRGPVTLSPVEPVDGDQPLVEVVTETLSAAQVRDINTLVKIDQARVSGLKALADVYFKKLAKLLPDVPMVTAETLDNLSKAEQGAVTDARQVLTEKALSLIQQRGTDSVH